MKSQCDACGMSFQREPGFYLGAIYFNYGITALIVAVAYPVLVLGQIVSSKAALIVCTIFVIVFPISIFRISRGLWLGFDELIDPQRRSGKKRSRSD